MNYSVKLKGEKPIYRVISTEGLNLEKLKTLDSTLRIFLNHPIDGPFKVKLEQIEKVFTQRILNLNQFNPNFNLKVLNLISEQSDEYKKLDIEGLRLILVQTQKMFNDINERCEIKEFRELES